MNKDARNQLRSAVVQCRILLERAVSEVLQGEFGIHLNGLVEPAERMGHLSVADQQYREHILTHLEHIKSFGLQRKDAIDQLVRETSFTHLNRLCAYKMMEKRGLIKETVSRGLKSKGFLLYLADHPHDEMLWSGNKQELAYRHFLEWVAGTLSAEIGVLFSPNDLANRLFPPFRVLDKVLSLINSPKLEDVWIGNHDDGNEEVIGWVYQYFTPKELRDQARKESQAPRSSYELAFRNQFYTPRYVVQFLAENTLGRMWYEMRRGETVLAEKCRYLVRLPHEIFLSPGKERQQEEHQSDEEVLKRPVYVKYRAKKDPREIMVLDPACGSGHFLLYCFDLLQTIYEEAYEDEELGAVLKNDYRTLDDFRSAVPALILTHNLHGIDIDLRATQIAGLALWLRCQRAYKELEIPTQGRPRITRTNIVCAEPMPGEKELLEEFVERLQPPLLGQLVRVVFEKMKLAGEAGSLLRIEEEISGAIAEAKKHWRNVPRQEQLILFQRKKLPETERQALFDLTGITDEQFWQEAEARVMESLREYAETVATNGEGLLRRLFADDAAQGFAFIDICRKSFDVVLMNPPFGEASKRAKDYLEVIYPETKNDIFAMFVERFLMALNSGGQIGVISNKTGFFLQSFVSWRNLITHYPYSLLAAIDLGFGVLDSAVVETMVYTISRNTEGYKEIFTPFIRVVNVDDKESKIERAVRAISTGERLDYVWLLQTKIFDAVPNGAMCYWVPTKVLKIFEECKPFAPEYGYIYQGIATGDNFRFLRNRWEVDVADVALSNWRTYIKGGESVPYYANSSLIVRWNDDGREIKVRAAELYGSASRTVKNEETFGKPGLTYTQVTVKGFFPRTMPAGSIYDMKGPLILAPTDNLFFVLGVLASLPIGTFAKMLTDARQWHPTNLMSLPFPNLTTEDRSRVAEITKVIVRKKQSHDLSDETACLFLSPIHQGADCTDSGQFQFQSELDQIVSRGFGTELKDFVQLNDYFSVPISADANEEEEFLGEDGATKDGATNDTRISSYISYAIGCAFGRWDVRYATGERSAPDLPNPFAPLPVCASGALTGADGLPLRKSPPGYPLRVDWDGILVDDPQHHDDIIRRIRDVFELIWQKRAEEIEREACELLDVKTLGDYFHKPAARGFWMDHVKRYSKDRRKTPIYWLLRSSKGNYAIWLYYHRLDKDILFKTLLNYVEPKLQLEENNLAQLKQRREAVGTTGREGKQLEKDLDKQELFLSELYDFRDKLKRTADLNLEPNLNDGVVLNIAPLWELVPWKEAEKYWKELIAGKYEWSSIAQQLRERGLVKQ